MESPTHHQARSPYATLAVELLVDFVIMYLVMYAMIDTAQHFHLNLDNVYMTLMMVAPMAIVMLVLMGPMFPSRRANLMIVAGAVVGFAIGLVGMRTQAGIGDAQFLRAMIPHHSGAILMCEKARITDPELKELCRQIVRSQAQEIAQMEAMLKRR